MKKALLIISLLFVIAAPVYAQGLDRSQHFVIKADTSLNIMQDSSLLVVQEYHVNFPEIKKRFVIPIDKVAKWDRRSAVSVIDVLKATDENGKYLRHRVLKGLYSDYVIVRPEYQFSGIEVINIEYQTLPIARKEKGKYFILWDTVSDDWKLPVKDAGVKLNPLFLEITAVRCKTGDANNCFGDFGQDLVVFRNKEPLTKKQGFTIKAYLADDPDLPGVVERTAIGIRSNALRVMVSAIIALVIYFATKIVLRGKKFSVSIDFPYNFKAVNAKIKSCLRDILHLLKSLYTVALYYLKRSLNSLSKIFRR